MLHLPHKDSAARYRKAELLIASMRDDLLHFRERT
jgi:hypothetical protein